MCPYGRPSVVEMIDEIRKEVSLDFAIIGGIRSGATALGYALRQHPRIRMPRIFDTCMFGRDLLKIALKPVTPHEYCRLLSESPLSGSKKLVGDKCSFWLISAHAIEEILRLNKHCKIIVILRNPLEVLVSLWQYNLQQGLYSSSELEDALLMEDKWRKGIGIHGKVRFLQQVFLTEHVRYGTHLSRLIERVPKRNILVVPYNLWKQNPRDVLVRVFDFLGIEDDIINDIKVRSIGESRVFRWKFLDGLLGQLPVRIVDMIPIQWQFYLWQCKELLTRPLTARRVTDPSDFNFPTGIRDLVRDELLILKSLQFPLIGPVVDDWMSRMGEMKYEG